MSRSSTAHEKWSRIIEEQRSSGLSVSRFCGERGISASSFFPWRRKLAGAASAAPPPPVFVEAKVRGVDGERGDRGGGGGGVTIALVGGRRLMVGRGFDRQLLLEVIDVLESSGGGS